MPVPLITWSVPSVSCLIRTVQRTNTALTVLRCIEMVGVTSHVHHRIVSMTASTVTPINTYSVILTITTSADSDLAMAFAMKVYTQL